MGKKRGGGRRKKLKVTPKKVIQVGAGLVGLKMIADADPKGFVMFLVNNPKSLADPKLYVDAAKRFGPGVVVASVGPKAVGKAVDFAAKIVPGGSRVTNATIVRV